MMLVVISTIEKNGKAMARKPNATMSPYLHWVVNCSKLAKSFLSSSVILYLLANATPDFAMLAESITVAIFGV